MIDPYDLEQVIFNLVINARDALPRRRRIHIDVGLERDRRRPRAARRRRRAGRLRPASRPRQRHRHDRRRPVASLRAVLHDQGSGRGHRPRPRLRPRHRAPRRRLRHGRHRARQGTTVSVYLPPAPTLPPRRGREPPPLPRPEPPPRRRPSCSSRTKAPSGTWRRRCSRAPATASSPPRRRARPARSSSSSGANRPAPHRRRHARHAWTRAGRAARRQRPDLRVLFVSGYSDAMPGPVRAAGAWRSCPSPLPRRRSSPPSRGADRRLVAPWQFDLHGRASVDV